MNFLRDRIFGPLAARHRRFGSAWRKWVIGWVNRNVTFGPGVMLDRNVIIRTFDGGAITIGANTHVWPGAILEARGGRINIGRNALVNAGCYIVAIESIVVGDDALIAEYVTIRDQDHARSDPSRPYGEQGSVSGPISLGRNVWLGAKVTVTRGVAIADNVVVGANSVVTRSLGPGVYAGSPARLIGGKP